MSSEIVTTTGRRMSRALAEALDDVTGSRRRAMVEVFDRTDPASATYALNRALAVELGLCGLREQDALHTMSVDLVVADEPGDPPWPQATGRTMWLDATGNEADPPEDLP